ncbi:MAG: hypothetical protein HPY50_06780 [Firmicutes bacterium]|nr:hypothetical protein [Bacillota bacterium]
MTLGRELIGLPVVEMRSGRQLGVIEDLLLDLEHSRLSSLQVRSGRWLEGCRELELSRVSQIGPDGVIVEDEPAWSGTATEGLLNVKPQQGKRIIDTAGVEMGTLEDIEFDAETGELAGWEYSDGIIQDLIKGRRYLPLGLVSTYGEDRVIIGEGVGTA